MREPSVCDQTAKQAAAAHFSLFRAQFHKREKGRGKCSFTALPPMGFMEFPDQEFGAGICIDPHGKRCFSQRVGLGRASRPTRPVFPLSWAAGAGAPHLAAPTGTRSS